MLTVIVGTAGLFPATVRSQSEPGASAVPQLSEKRLQLVFNSAQGFLERENYNNAFPLLQAILNQSQDALIPIDPDNPAKSVSLKGEVLKSIRTLPRFARQSYNLQYDAQARELLDSIDRGAERNILEEIVRRFFFTETGLDAAVRLANLYFDRGEFFSAGLMFERLLDDGRISRQSIPGILFQTAICWHKSDLLSKTQESLLRLKSMTPGEGFVLAGRSLKLFEDASDSIAWLEQHADLTNESNARSRVENWLTFRGDSGRNASSDPVMPLREKEWEFRTVPLAEASDPRQLELIEQRLRELTEKFQNTSYLTFPAYHPLVVDQKIIFRALGNLKAVDATTGDLIWENHFLDEKFKELLNTFPSENFSISDSRITEMQKYIMQRSWRDLSSGQLSSDGRYVYSVENQKLVDGEYDFYGRFDRTGENNSNLLMAHEIANGNEVWNLGHAGTHYAGTVFLGPPLIQGEGLYCLAEKNEELRLLAFRNRLTPSGAIDPVELWSQPLSVSTVHEETFGDPMRRISGLTPTYCNGMLICPTGRGTIIAYDLAHRIFSWRYEYQDAPLHSRNTIGSLNQLRQNHGIGPEDESRWIDPTPVAAGSRLFVTPTDSNSLYCLDALEGNLLWSVPREDDLYLACVHRNAVVLVGREKIHALDVNDGEELWTIPISRPSGRGYLANDRYFVPLSTAAIACVDVARGELLATVPSDYSRVPGNLVAAGGNVISLSADRLFCYETALPQDPESASSMYEMQGKQKLFEGHLGEAIELLLKAQESEPASARQLLLTELMLDAIRRDFDENSKFIDPLKEFTRGTPESAVLEELLAEGFQKSGKSREAFALFLNTGQLPKKEVQRKNHRIRSDLWARAHLEELYRNGSNDERIAFDELLDEIIASVQDPVSSSDLLQLIEGVPGRESLLRERIERIEPYTQTLAFEQSLIRLQHSSSPEMRREGLAKHFKWLMKLDRIEQAAVLRERLLAEVANVVCLDGQTGAELVRWGEENRKLANYLKWQHFKWPAGSPRVVPYNPDNSAIVSSSNSFTPIEGDPGLFRDWRFEYVNNPRRLIGFGPFGNRKLELPVAYLNRNPYQLNHGRKIHLHGHLAVIEFFDHFFVFDLFQNGDLAFLHGPHQLAQPLAGVETSSTRSGKTQTVTAPNGQPETEIVDVFDQKFGEIGVVTEEAIVHQSGRRLIAIDSLSGELRWQRHLASRGQHLFGNRNIVCALPRGSETVTQFRTLDGSLAGQYDLGPVDRVLSTIEDRLIVQTNLESRTKIVCHDVPERRILWQTDCAEDSLFQTIETTELAILERTGQFRVLSLEDGSTLAQMKIEPPKQILAEGEGAENPNEAVSPPEWLAFWIQPFTEGWLVITQESITEKNQTIRVSQLTDSVAVHGDMTYLGRDGKVRWNKRIERQGFSIAHPPTTPVIVLCVRQLPIPGQFARPLRSALVQLIDLATGENIGPQSDNYQDNGFQIVVSPADSRAEILSSKSAHAVIYGSEEGTQDQATGSPGPTPP